MTFETAKRLYDYYMKKGMTAQAEDIAMHRPDVKTKPTTEKTKKSK